MITVNITKGRAIAHTRRRAMRQAALEPLDEQINWYVADAAKVAELEAQRQTIRDKYATMQTAIDAATDMTGIAAALEA